MRRTVGAIAGLLLGLSGGMLSAASPPSDWVYESDADIHRPGASRSSENASVARAFLAGNATESTPPGASPAVGNPTANEPPPPAVVTPLHTDAVVTSPAVAMGLDEAVAESGLPENPACRNRHWGPLDDAEAVRFLQTPGLDARRIRLGGWIDQGFTWNPENPANRFNGPVTFNDRSNEYLMNQFYAFADRRTETGGCGLDWGGRIDALYGTDWRFLASSGLDADWNGSQRFYGVALPQFYADVAVDDWIFRVGKFASMLGYDTFTAVDNFFYSRTYTLQYGEPHTFTGFLAKYKVSERLSAVGGITSGWDRIVEADAKASFLGALRWTSDDDATTLDLGITAGSEPAFADSTRTLVTVVLTHRLTERWRGVLQYDGALETNTDVQGAPKDSTWDGVSFCLFYDLNSCWTAGFRYEWFGDSDGIRVAGLGYPHGIAWSPVAGNWQDIALGLNYRRNANLTWRTEVRWDWFDASGSQALPFDDSTRGSQFLWSTDLVVRF